jgi:hypothetical protein
MTINYLEKGVKKKYTLVVLTNSLPGKDDAFNDWYTNRHLKDVIAVPGFVSAQRYRIVGQPVAADPPYRYFASYEIEADDPSKVLAEMNKRAGTDLMPISDGMDPKVFVTLYETITPKVTGD